MVNRKPHWFDKLVLRKISGTHTWRVEKEFRVEVKLYDGMSIIVPRDFKTDLASVPQLLWSIFPKSGVYTEASVVHDYLYSGMSSCSKRSAADKIFVDMCKELGVSDLRANLMYLGIRIFGGKRFVKK